MKIKFEIKIECEEEQDAMDIADMLSILFSFVDGITFKRAAIVSQN